MENKKTFKPPAKKTGENKSIQNRGVSLTDQQYNEIFNAVLKQQSSQPETMAKSPTCARSPGQIVALSPKECASVENSQHSQPETAKASLAPVPVQQEKNTDSTIHTINSEEFAKNANFSTPTIAAKPKTFRAALNSLKNKLNESLSESLTESIDHTFVDMWDQAKLSQPPKGLTKKERLQWLQDRRGVGLYVKCDSATCGKWRWLDTPDPVDVPEIWTCNLNPDKNYNSCHIPEKMIPLAYEEDMIHNSYTAGSIVWAKMPGYPWWPAMVDDCPDCEQYYWLENIYDDVPTWYHIVFFDSAEVTRQWVRAEDLLSYKHRHLYKAFKVKPYLKKRFNVSKEKADKALQMSIKERLQRFSFLALWKGDIPEDPDSDNSESESEIPTNTQDFNNYIKKRIYRRRKSLANSSIHSAKEVTGTRKEISRNEFEKNEGRKTSTKITNRSKSTTSISVEKKPEATKKEKKDLNKSFPLSLIEKTSVKITTDNNKLLSPTDDSDSNESCTSKKEKYISKSTPKKPKKITSAVRRSLKLSTESKFDDKTIDQTPSKRRRSLRLSTDSKDGDKKFNSTPSKLRRSLRLSTESAGSTESTTRTKETSSKKIDNEKENKTPQKLSANTSVEKIPKNSINKSEQKPKKKRSAPENSDEEISKNKKTQNSEEKEFIAPKKNFLTIDSGISTTLPENKKQKLNKPGMKMRKPFVSPMVQGVNMLNTSSSSFTSSTLGTIFEEDDD